MNHNLLRLFMLSKVSIAILKQCVRFHCLLMRIMCLNEYCLIKTVYMLSCLSILIMCLITLRGTRLRPNTTCVEEGWLETPHSIYPQTPPNAGSVQPPAGAAMQEYPPTYGRGTTISNPAFTGPAALTDRRATPTGFTDRRATPTGFTDRMATPTGTRIPYKQHC